MLSHHGDIRRYRSCTDKENYLHSAAYWPQHLPSHVNVDLTPDLLVMATAPNALFCVLESPNDMLSPCPEAVKQHRRFGAIWVPPGARLSQAVEAIREYAQLPPGSVISYLAWGGWSRIRDLATCKQAVEPGQTYCFRIAAFDRSSARKRRKMNPKALPLHQMLFPMFLLEANISEASFKSFMTRSSTIDLCKDMVAKSAAICASADSDKQEALCREFQEAFGVAVCCGDQWWKISSSSVGVLLERNTFISVMTVKPGYNGYIQSTALPLSDEDHKSLTELGFLFWVAQLLKIKPVVKIGQEITLVDCDQSKQVHVVQELTKSSVLSNSVVRVSDGHRQLVMKVGHSPEAKRIMEDLRLQSQVYDQTINEASILRKLRDCSSVPPFAFYGYWDNKPVLLTELQGSSLDEGWLPLETDMLEKLCKDLTSIVFELHERGVAHGDINPSNIGVYSRPEEHNGRRFYLYDFGFAVELPHDQVQKNRVAANKLFSSRATLESGMVSVVTELVSIVYTCLYLAGVILPWQDVLDWGPSLVCSLQEDFVCSLADDVVFLELPSVFRDWVVFVLGQPSDAKFARVRQAAREILLV